MTALVQGDVAGLPFADGAFDLVLSAFTHSDVDDFEAVAREGRRLLRPLAAPMAPGWSIPDTDKWAGAPAVRGPWSGAPDRVGFRHLPLADLLNSVLEAGLRLLHVEEGGNGELPEWLALVARRLTVAAYRVTVCRPAR